MKQIITLLKFYYRLVGNKLFLLFFLMAAAVGFQALSVSLFLPILQGKDSDNKITQITGRIFDFLGLEYTLFYLLVFLVCFFFLRSIFLVGQTSLVGKIMADLLVNLRCKIAKNIFQMDYQAFLNKSSGYLNNALIVEFHKVVFSFKMFSNLMITILFAGMYVSIPLLLHPVLVLVLTGIGFPLFLIIKRINSLTRDYSLRTSNHSANLQKILIQSLNYFKYLKATYGYPNVLKQIFSQSKTLGVLQCRLNILGAITEFGFEPFVVLIISGVVFYNVGLQGQDIIENIFLLFLLLNAMKQMLATQGNFRKILSSWGSIEVLKILELELERSKEKAPSKSMVYNASFDQPIRYENVSFGYNNEGEILRDINIEIPPNSTVAFVGESGAGKTTLVNLLIGLLQPTRGTISIGGKPYQDIDPSQIRKDIGYITQENVIFNDTIYNNITLWNSNNPDNNSELLESVAKKAHIYEFIKGLENSFDSVLGEGGVNVSGGQRQRICIARELYKNAKILIFDEATSSLDTKTEKDIQKNIDEFKGQKTICIVAHRLSTVRNSDKIFVLKNGSIVEEGSYEELYNLDGEFRRMVVQQNS
ncbi:MAG: ABC transporter ATP-binding protein [Candidatus Scalinduaceae bacterium]